MISIQNVSHGIGGQTILDNVSLDIPQGGITALIGPNGAGKSTLLSFMARLQPLKHGKITCGGLDVTATPTAELAKTLSILTQENNIVSRISVWNSSSEPPTIAASSKTNLPVCGRDE